ncbi:MAG: hypothetical protein AAF851_07910 [Myxococcota bacterium]
MRLLLPLIALALPACHTHDEATTEVPFSDDFERSELGPDWFPSGGVWHIQDGRIESYGGNNAPLFLKAALPADVVVQVEVRTGHGVDAKVELMADGLRHSTGYVFIMGGWDNERSCIARLDEHGRDRKCKKPTGVKGKSKQLWRIEKKGGDIDWYVDGALYLEFDDPEPLSGPGHDRFAFSNWQSHLHYDDLRIWPYAEAPPR